MSELLLGGSAWWIVPVSLLVFGATFGLLPGLMLRLLVRLYPKNDPRRRELFAELYGPKMTRLNRFEWVFQQLETALRDGLASRRELRRRQLKLVSAREGLIACIHREFAGRRVMVTCKRDGTVRCIRGLEDLTTDDMVSGTTINITSWGIRQRPRAEFSSLGAEPLEQDWPAEHLG
jgi:hypothetical protein